MPLYKNSSQAKLFGVCAGLAEFWGLDVGLVRIACVFFSFMFPPTLFSYLLLASILSDTPHSKVQSDNFNAALDSVEQQLQFIEQHVLQLENYVTSDSFALQKKLWELSSK